MMKRVSFLFSMLVIVCMMGFATGCAKRSTATPAPVCNDDVVALNDLRMMSQMVHFPTNSDQLTTEDIALLQRKAAFLKNVPSMKVRIEGNCDERGSIRYNDKLGMRRANTVANFFRQQGLPDSQIEVVSYGERYPLVKGHNESAWSQNRRDEFHVIVD